MKRIHFFWAALTALSACNDRSNGHNGSLGEAIKGATASLPQAGAMVRAAARGDVEEMQKLQLEGASVDEDLGHSTNHVTPLLASIVMNQAEALAYLLRNGVPCYQGFKGYTPVDFVNYFKTIPGHERLYQTLLDSGKCDL